MQAHRRISAIAIILIVTSLLLIGFGAGIASGFNTSTAPSLPPEVHTFYFPAIYSQNANISIANIWMEDPGETPQIAFLQSATVTHQLTGFSASPQPVSATLQIMYEGPCSNGLVHTSSVTLPTGSWQESTLVTTPECSGIFTATTSLVLNHKSIVTSTQFIINNAISPTYTNLQGFDRCTHPTPEEMQAWWDASPYTVFNLYLGGIHYPSSCEDPAIDAYWVHAVGNQGWQFTTVWVGPQAPCTEYLYKMSYNLEDAYLEGKSEAVQAAEAARSLGLIGNLTIHYDVEGYTYLSGATQSCRNAVRSFIQGWTDQLHELDLKAGAYGGACSSAISEWATNSPSLDQIWIAHWETPAEYDPNITVWNSPCVSNDLWAQQQRLRQYAGDHYETHNSIKLGIDSNVFDTTVISLTQSTDPVTPTTQISIHDYGLVSVDAGWVLFGNRLLWTSDLGKTWADRSPEDFNLLSAEFLDEAYGWTTGWSGDGAGLQIGRTTDNGQSWAITPLANRDNLSSYPIVDATFEVLDKNTLWLSIKLQSGSAFSNGLLFASSDGGLTWDQRSIPTGDPVHFTSNLNGWIYGGPSGREYFKTEDGGHTWERMIDSTPTLDTPETVFINQPENVLSYDQTENDHAWALTQRSSCFGEKKTTSCYQEQILWLTQNNGETWLQIPIP